VTDKFDLTKFLDGTADVSPAVSEGTSIPFEASAVASGGIAHDGSSMTNELATWLPARLSADAEILPEKDILDARTADMLRNDAYNQSAVTIWKDSIVGAVYLLNSQPATKVLFGKADDIWEKEYQEEVETKFSLAAESQSNYFDTAKINTFTAIIRLSVGSYIAGGESIILSEWLSRGNRPFRTSTRMIEADRLSDPYDRHLRPGLRLRKGVELDPVFGSPRAYWFKNTHPSEGPYHNYSSQEDSKWTRVEAFRPWGRPNVLHIFEQMRPDQHRGLSALTAALSDMRAFQKFSKTQLQKAIISATYAASLESELPNDAALALGAGSSGDGNPTTKWMLDYLATVDQYSSGSNNLHMSGAKIPILTPGMKLNLQNPGAAGPDHESFVATILRKLAASFDLSYEQFSRDFTKTNYSSARASLGESWKSLQTKKKMVADRTATFIYRLWLEEMINSGGIEALKRKNVPNFYEGLNADAYSQAEWIGAGRGVIDPLKETQADVLALQHGLDTKEAVIARRYGRDWRKTATQIAREYENDKALNVPSVYDTMPIQVQPEQQGDSNGQ
jgi:lambda family phage portal protein